jgi:carnitine 3-dehydrogenase
VLGGNKTGSAAIDNAMRFYTSIGMRALKVRKEIDGYIADRLQEALWREILHLVNDGVATTGEIDDAIRYGPGLRWAFMGTNLIYHLAGGEGGMRHMLEQFGPALDLPWTNHKAPKLTPELVDRMVEGTAEQAKGWTIKELERFRDDCIIRVTQAVEEARKAAGGKAPV